jgi:toxin ParE1/3/4
MAYEVRVSQSAERDLNEILQYITDSLFEPAAAGRFLKSIEECYNQLRSNPFVYALSSDNRLQSEGYRKVVIGKYLLMFTVEEKVVFIHRIFYGARDYIKFL